MLSIIVALLLALLQSAPATRTFTGEITDSVQPVLALAVEVRMLGHEVRLCVPPTFIDWVATSG